MALKRMISGTGAIGAEYTEEPSFMPPDGADIEGDEGEALVRWRKAKDGTIHITSFDGIKLGPPDESPEEEAEEPGNPVEPDGDEM